MNFLYRLRESFARMMVGRYGIDDLSRFMLTVFFVIVIVQIFVRSRIINGVELIFLIVLYFRMFSRNFQARSRENDIFLNIKNKILRRTPGSRSNEDRVNYKYFNCPSCKQRMRVPRGKGKIEIRCSKCGHVFNKRS